LGVLPSALPHPRIPILPLDIVTVTLYYRVKENANMEIGDIVKFIDGLYPDEKGAKYKVVEINGDRAVIVFICDLPIPPQSIAKISELEIVHQK
jgi:transcription antitermination factor NusG